MSVKHRSSGMNGIYAICHKSTHARRQAWANSDDPGARGPSPLDAPYRKSLGTWAALAWAWHGGMAAWRIAVRGGVVARRVARTAALWRRARMRQAKRTSLCAGARHGGATGTSGVRHGGLSTSGCRREHGDRCAWRLLRMAGGRHGGMADCCSWWRGGVVACFRL